METERIFPGVWEFRTEYGRDTAELFTDGAMPHAAWFVAGDHPAILDPGPTSIAEELLDAIGRLGHDTDAIEWIVPSHIHIDHAGGSGWLVRELPRAKAVFHTRGAPFMRDPARLIAGTADVFGETWEAVFGDILPVPDESMVTVEDGDTLDFGSGAPYRIVFMPGHSLDHIGVYDEANEALYCGHGLGNYKPPRFLPDPPMTLPYFDVDASIASIRKARDLAPEVPAARPLRLPPPPTPPSPSTPSSASPLSSASSSRRAWRRGRARPRWRSTSALTSSPTPRRPTAPTGRSSSRTCATMSVRPAGPSDPLSLRERVRVRVPSPVIPAKAGIQSDR